MDVRSEEDEDDQPSYHPTDSMITGFNSNHGNQASWHRPSETGLYQPITHQMPALPQPDTRVQYSHPSMLNNCNAWYSHSANVTQPMPPTAFRYDRPYPTSVSDYSEANRFANMNQPPSHSVNVTQPMPPTAFRYDRPYPTSVSDYYEANRFANMNQPPSHSTNGL